MHPGHPIDHAEVGGPRVEHRLHAIIDGNGTNAANVHGTLRRDGVGQPMALPKG